MTAPAGTSPMGRTKAIRGWFVARPLWARVAIGCVAVLVGANLLSGVLSSLAGGGQPSGPAGSSYATSGSGMAAWAELLKRQGHDVVRLKKPLESGDVAANATLVVVTPDEVHPAEVAAMRSLLRRGGRVVLLGNAGSYLLDGSVGRTRWVMDSATTAAVTSDAPEVQGLKELDSSEGLRFTQVSQVEVLAGSATSALVVASEPGAFPGRLVLVSNAGVLSNERLARADNAAFALQVVGDGPVYFAEAFHGYGDHGWDVVPRQWRTALTVWLAAIVLALWAVVLRFGPIEDEVRDLPPPRRLYVEAMAAGELRGHDPTQVVGPMQAELRRRLRRRTGLSSTADDASLAAAAASTGLPADVVGAALTVPLDDQQLLTVCQAAAHLIAIDQGDLPNPLTGAHP